MIVHQNDRGGVEFQRAFGDLARVDRHVIDGAFGLLLIPNQGVFAIKKEHAKLLRLAVGHRGVAVI